MAYLEDCAVRGLSVEEVKAEMRAMLELAKSPSRRRVIRRTLSAKAKVIDMAA